MLTEFLSFTKLSIKIILFSLIKNNNFLIINEGTSIITILFLNCLNLIDLTILEICFFLSELKIIF